MRTLFANSNAADSRKGCGCAVGAVLVIALCVVLLGPVFRHTLPSKEEYLLRYLPEAHIDQERVTFFFGGGVGGDATFARMRMTLDADLAWTNQWALTRVVDREKCLLDLHLLSSEFGITAHHTIVVSNDFSEVTEVQEFEDGQTVKGMNLTRRLYVVMSRPVTLYLATFGPD